MLVDGAGWGSRQFAHKQLPLEIDGDIAIMSVLFRQVCRLSAYLQRLVGYVLCRLDKCLLIIFSGEVLYEPYRYWVLVRLEPVPTSVDDSRSTRAPS